MSGDRPRRGDSSQVGKDSNANRDIFKVHTPGYLA